MRYKSNAVLMDGTGDPCPRCGQPMRIFEHREISDRQRKSPFYYARWHRCLSDSCKTTVVMRDEDRIWNIDGEDRTNLEQWLTKHVERDQKAG
jgi:hypothetical protein